MMRAYLLNLALGLLYVALAGDPGWGSLVIGLGVGFLLVSLHSAAVGAPQHGGKALRLFRFLGYFLTILVKSNLQVAWEIITPGHQMSPRIIRVDVAGLGDAELTTLANCITLTPGTLVMDVTEDRRWMYVHCMYARDPGDPARDIAELRRRLREEVFS